MATKAEGDALLWGFLYEDHVEEEGDYFVVFLLLDRCKNNPIAYALELAVMGASPLYSVSVTRVEKETNNPVEQYTYRMYEDLETALFEYDYMLMLRQLKVKID